MESEIYQIGLLGGAGVVLWIIYKIISVIFGRKKDPINGSGKAILAELKTQNENHLHSMENGMMAGFDKIANKQDRTNELLFELLGLAKSKK